MATDAAVSSSDATTAGQYQREAPHPFQCEVEVTELGRGTRKSPFEERRKKMNIGQLSSVCPNKLSAFEVLHHQIHHTQDSRARSGRESGHPMTKRKHRRSNRRKLHVVSLWQALYRLPSSSNDCTPQKCELQKIVILI